MLRYNGRSDGLGNRIGQIITAEAYCNRFDVLGDYYWNEDRLKCPILIKAKNVTIQSKRRHDIPREQKISLDNKVVSKLEDFSQKEKILAAKNITTIFNEWKDCPIDYECVHIRCGDRTVQNITKEMSRGGYITQELWRQTFDKCIKEINKKRPKNLCICSEEESHRLRMIEELDSRINIVDPLAKKREDENNVYKDFFSMVRSKRVYMCSKFSSFSTCASLVGGIPLVSFFEECDTILHRYKALVEVKPLRKH